MSTIPLEDGTLWYEARGTGPPLVFLHGGWQNSDAWLPQVNRYAGEYRVVTPDLRGHGETGATGSPRYSVDLLTDDLERVLDHLDIDAPILCGCSLGGMVVQSYLDRHPERARAAVICGPIQSMPPVDIPPGVKPFVSPLPAVAGMVSMVGPTATFRSLLASIRATTGRRWLTVDSAVRSRAMDALDDVSVDEFLKIFQTLYGHAPPDLSHVRTPTLVLYGDHEAPPVKRQGKRLARTVAHGSWQELSGAGHLVNQDAPRAFDGACSEFFAEIDRIENRVALD
jgi:pimeloyl-ACP methyl ester carboxylesterase